MRIGTERGGDLQLDKLLQALVGQLGERVEVVWLSWTAPIVKL
jgi:hypothetical protein